MDLCHAVDPFVNKDLHQESDQNFQKNFEFSKKGLYEFGRAKKTGLDFSDA